MYYGKAERCRVVWSTERMEHQRENAEIANEQAQGDVQYLYGTRRNETTLASIRKRVREISLRCERTIVSHTQIVEKDEEKTNIDEAETLPTRSETGMLSSGIWDEIETKGPSEREQ